ncbi:MAG: peptidase M14, partial [bacterium]|nr:peptidase M14 [bacterium]
TPAEHLGFPPGEDFKLADFSQISGYFEKLDQASDRLRLVEFGKSAHGKPMFVAFISSAENLNNLERIQKINQRMALGQATPEEAASLAKQGKAVVWIDSGLHPTEVAPAQPSPELAYRMVTGEDDETREIRQNVILMQVPVINPDGLDWVVHWYRENVGTPYELAPLPRLYQKYAGHDNNRDS